jgi:hypothetical protein
MSDSLHRSQAGDIHTEKTEDRQTNMNKTNENSYARMGMAAIMPGLQRAVELLTAKIEKFQALLRDDMTPSQRFNVQAKTQKSPLMKDGIRIGPGGYWDKLTAEQRRKEMEQRGLVRRGKALPKDKTTARAIEEKRRKDREAKAKKREAVRAARLAS